MLYKLFTYVLALDLIAGISAAPVSSYGNPLYFRNTEPGSSNLESLHDAYVYDYQESLADDVFTSDFYQVPENYSESLSPGRVLKINNVSNNITLSTAYAHPPGIGVDLYRIMYTSKTMYGKVVPATGFMYLPQKNYEGGSSPRTLVWTHGTQGGTRECAPSVIKSKVGWTIGLSLAIDGYTFIASDYVGRGSEGEFHYMSAVEHATDAGNILKAAREAFGDTTVNEWAVIGNSEGGMSAWATNQEQKKDPAGGFLGAVSLAPSLSFSKTFAWWFSTPELRHKLKEEVHLGVFYSLQILRSMEQLVENFEPNKYLTSLGQQVFALLSENGCNSDGSALLKEYKVDEIYSDFSWTNSSASDDWIAMTQNDGQQALAKPMLILQGDKDVDVPAKDTLGHYEAHCAKFGNNSPVMYHRYPEDNHNTLQWSGYPDYTEFIEKLFSKSDLPSQCTKETVGASK